jgi:arylformamidase
VKQAGHLHRLVVAPGLNHFEIPETMARADGLLGRAALELMGLV